MGGNKMNLEELKNKYGVIEYEGKKYILLEEADFTNGVLPGNWNYNDVEAGEEYQFQMKAEAADESGEKLYDVFWIFWEVKGDEKLPEDFDYDNVNHVEEIEIEYYHYDKYGFFIKPEEF